MEAESCDSIQVESEAERRSGKAAAVMSVVVCDSHQYGSVYLFPRPSVYKQTATVALNH